MKTRAKKATKQVERVIKRPSAKRKLAVVREKLNDSEKFMLDAKECMEHSVDLLSEIKDVIDGAADRRIICDEG